MDSHDEQRPGFTPPPAGATPEGAPHVDAPGAPEVLASTEHRSGRRTAGLVAAAVGIGAIGIAGAAYAAAADPSPSATGGSERPSVGGMMGGYGDRDGDGDGPGMMPGAPGQQGQEGQQGQGGMMGGRHGGPGMRGLGMGIHGSFVVPQPDGSGYQTVLMQRGEVTAVSSSSITVTSQDGFSARYAVTADTKVGMNGTIDGIKVGDTVGVLALKDGDSATAQRIMNGAFPGGDRDGDGPGGQGPGGEGAAPSPDSTSSTT